MERLKDIFKSMLDYVARMTASQVMMLFGVIAGSIVGIVLMVGWLNDINYARLYSGLDEGEAGEVITYLTDNKIPYQLVNGGRSIEIPQSEVYKTRIALAAQGMPRSGNIGYSLFDQNNLGMTDFLQNLNFRRALEGELTKTIMELNEVQAARVHIVMPKDRLFKKDQKEATASVVLKLRGAGGLSGQQIKGITHLIASSVEGLEPSKISIVDYDGNLLSSGTQSDPLAGLSSSQLEVRKQVEQYLEEKAQTMMDNVLGPNKSVIRVTADLNFQQIERTSETFDPNAPSIRSEERVKTTASVSDKDSEAANESTQDDNSETVITNYELNKTVEHIINAIGTIDRLSVAVMVDGHYEADETTEGGEMIYQPRGQDELDQLSSIVKNAVGFDQQRNDQIEMINIAFDRNNLDMERDMLDSIYMQEFYLDIAKKIGYFLLIAMILLYFKKKSKKLFGALSRIVPPPPKVVAPPPEKMDNKPKEEELVPEVRAPKLVERMQETAKDQPEEIARVIKTMMIE